MVSSQASITLGCEQEATAVLTSEPTLDGYVWSGNIQGVYNEWGIKVGNGQDSHGFQFQFRGFLSFDLSSIPSGATIRSGELRFYQADVSGKPCAVVCNGSCRRGALWLYHVDYGSSLDDGDWDLPSLDSEALEACTQELRWYNVGSDPIAGWVQEDLDAGRTRFQVRLNSSSEADFDSIGLALFEPGENYYGSGSIPELSVTYVVIER
jgi:hypothetical protein